jgi:hypothetical protein
MKDGSAAHNYRRRAGVNAAQRCLHAHGIEDQQEQVRSCVSQGFWPGNRVSGVNLFCPLSLESSQNLLPRVRVAFDRDAYGSKTVRLFRSFAASRLRVNLHLMI